MYLDHLWGSEAATNLCNSRETLAQAELNDEVITTPHFSCYLIDRRLFEVVGEFDEQFEPAYHEDSDMIYRMQLLRQQGASTNTARFFHLDRVTLKWAMASQNQEFLDKTRVLMDKSMERYSLKWGGMPGNEKFQTPYNK